MTSPAPPKFVPLVPVPERTPATPPVLVEPIQDREPVYKAVLSETALGWTQRGLWAMCVVVYLTVLVGGLMSGGDDLVVTGRAVGLTLTTAVLGKIGIGLLGRASEIEEPKEEEVPSAEEPGQDGSGDQPSTSTMFDDDDDDDDDLADAA
jgi:hypothetical protein